MRHMMLCLILSVAASAMAVDLTIGVGESETLSGVQAFDRIFCNGSLTIAEDAEISCTSFCMASGVVENVSVTLLNGSTLSMPAGGAGQCLIGCDGGAGTLTLGTNALFKTAKRVSVQYTTPQGNAFFSSENPFPTTAKISIHLMDGASIDGQYMESVLAFGDGMTLSYGPYGRFEGITVRLDKDANLNYCSFQQRKSPDCRILFNGGYLRQGYWNSDNTATLFSNVGWWSSDNPGARWYLTGTNRNDIVIQRDSYANSVFHLSSGGSKFTLDGDGGFVIRGTAGRNNVCGVSRLVNEDSSPTRADWIVMKFPGRIALEGNIWVMLAAWGNGAFEPGAPRSDFFPDGSTLVIGPNAGIELYGADITNATIMAEGAIVNGSANVSTIVTGGGDADGRIESLGTNIIVRKSGTGCMTLGTNIVDVAAVAVSAGSIAIDGKDEGNPDACIRELTLGAGTSCVTTESAKGRRIAVQRLDMDAAASAEIDTFAPVADGVLNLMNYEGDLRRTPVQLPLKVRKTADRKNFKSWSLYVNGELRGAEGSANPAVGIYDGWLTLGNFGTKIVFR